MSVETGATPSVSPRAAAKKPLMTVFLTLFLDLIGFSIIFPLFPALFAHYTATEQPGLALRLVLDLLSAFASLGNTGFDLHSQTTIVLFGGLVGGLYSLLQFAFAPLWGALSDRIGRKPVLLLTVSGLAISYALWGFAGGFGLLLLSRFLAGIMGGNLSAATAVVADVTSKETRARGMAIVGIAFALGFIVGPAMGGILSKINLLDTHPEWAAVGINPFSVPAFAACLLSLLNVLLLIFRFNETLPPHQRNHTAMEHGSPLLALKPLPYPGVNAINFAYFLFMIAFAGMEFTLTFLAVERFAFNPMQNASMFIVSGLVVILVQGGIVRRIAHRAGERRLAIVGLLLLVPSLALIGFSGSVGLLYAGLILLSCSSALATPCLSALVSMLSPQEVQGRVFGVYRSLGSLARAIGPIAASLLYWRYGSATPYYLGAAFAILPVLLIARQPK